MSRQLVIKSHPFHPPVERVVRFAEFPLSDDAIAYAYELAVKGSLNMNSRMDPIPPAKVPASVYEDINEGNWRSAWVGLQNSQVTLFSIEGL